ncbi:MAG: Mu-like prophage major head subunit gpT family protein [Anaerolineae bacterium]|nr:Mu-like prophage major head subunit gpT family protein [Anaerolineae bacterium]
MLLNAAALAGLQTAFRMDFNGGHAVAQTYYEQIATRVPSITAQNQYPWLGDLPGIREWIGDREVHKLAQHDYAIVNKPWEMTVGVNRDHIKDDIFGVYSPMFETMGFETARFPDQLIFQALLAGFDTNCYDGQYFFDTDHPGYDENGDPDSVSNYQSGSAAAWFLLDTRRPLKPLIYQEREMFNFVAMDQTTDEAVFNRKEFRYGVDGRMNVGYGFWQQAIGSKKTLDATNFNAAYASMMGFRKRDGNPMGIKPNLLVVGSTNRAAALEVVKAERAANGATNINRDAVDVLIVEWLP